MQLTVFLALTTIAVFVLFILLSKNPRKFYILFILFSFPVIDLPVTPPALGSFKVFDAISFLSFIFLLKDYNGFRKSNNVYTFLFLLLIGSLVIGSLASSNVYDSLVQILSIFPVFIFCKSILDECNSSTDFSELLLRNLKYIVILSLFFLIIQMCIGLDFTFYSELNQNTIDSEGKRYPSFFPEPQKFGQFLAITIFLFFIEKKNMKTPSFKNYLTAGLITFGIIAAGGRSAALGLFAGIFLLFFFLGSQFRKVVAVAAIVVLSLLSISSQSLLILKRTNNFSNDLSYRYSLWKEAFTIFEGNPLFGIGIGNYKHFAKTYSDNFYVTDQNDVVFFDQPESGYLMILSETGSIGFFVMFSLIFFPIFSTFKNCAQNRYKLPEIFFIAGILSWIVSFNSVYSLYDKRIVVTVAIFLCMIIYENRKLGYEK